MLMFKHTEETKSSRGFTIAELGAGLGVFALTASLMAPMALSSTTGVLAEGETIIQTVDNSNDGRQNITTPPVEAVEVTVLDANGNEVKKQNVTDPTATSAVITNLDPNGSYTFEVAKINAAGSSAKSVAQLDYKQTGTRSENYSVQVPYTVPKSRTYNSTARQVDDTSRPIYVQVRDLQRPKYRTELEHYQVPKSIRETKYRTESYQYEHLHQTIERVPYSVRVQRTRTYNHVHRQSYNHVHRTSYNHVHHHSRSWCHWHSRWFTCHRHWHRWTTNHTHWRNTNHTHWRNVNHTHHETYFVNETRFRNETRTFRHMHTATRSVPYTETKIVWRNRYRQVQVQDGYHMRNIQNGYHKKTEHVLSVPGQGTIVSSTPQSRTLRWNETAYRTEGRTRYHAVFGHVAEKRVAAPRNFVVFKASDLSNGRILKSGSVAAVGAGVTNASAGSTKSFLRWSGRTFTFNGEQYVQVHKWALRG